ncbi:Putative uncharacterized transposon-derived protein F52C9.6 [Eumeta japonica]|uniref:Uncharacterized transposon-derived protein F52C9.6 n=1 Tax=Eumeta variegata TaxID=151549 RepID=A0A4C1UHK5_EUMVA|nr:Putative uncharacterized transposon-derived protein F52C9.6 [Eumeta japonica]
MREEVKSRITNGWRSYWSLKEPMRDKKLHVNIKRKLFNICILPVFTYGCQSWTLTKEITNKLAIYQYAMERNMLSVKRSDKLRNCAIRYKTSTRDITLKVRKLKWRCTGHMIRGHGKWNKKGTRWYPREGKRKRGRPQKRWDDDIREVAGAMWNRVAPDRSEWKRLEEAFADGKQIFRKSPKNNFLVTYKKIFIFRFYI